jgi:hypothetical protein
MDLSNLISKVKKKYVAPRVNGTVVTPPVQPVAVAPVLTDPLLTVNNNIPPVTPAVTPATPVVNGDPLAPVATKPNLFSGTAAGVGTNYANTLNSALSGEMYDPFAAGQKEAQARAEANKRAATANQIAGAGFTGQGIGQQIASGTENELSRNRFESNIGIEKARNESRVGALGEARAYGTAEEGIRQYEQNFGQDVMVDKRNFDEDVRRYGQDYAESKRRFDTGQSNWQSEFDQEKTKYKDSQAWTAYEQALATGSDADVIAAYKAATGKDLDPMAVSQYRGYYRKGQENALAAGAQGLEAGAVAIETAKTTLDTMKKTAAGGDLKNYLSTHLDAKGSDPEVQPMLEAYWKSLGNTGPAPEKWKNDQVAAANDPRLTTEIGQAAYQADSLFSQGLITADQRDILKSIPTEALRYWVKQPDGTFKLDTQALLDSVGGSGSNAPPEGTAPGSMYIKDGRVYQADSATASSEISYDPDDVWAPDNDKILKAGEKDNPYYKTIFDARYKEVTNDGKMFTTGDIWSASKNEKISKLSFDDPIIQKLKSDLSTMLSTADKNFETVMVSGKKFYKTPSGGNFLANITIVKDGTSWKFAEKT